VAWEFSRATPGSDSPSTNWQDTVTHLVAQPAGAGGSTRDGRHVGRSAAELMIECPESGGQLCPIGWWWS